MPAWRNVLYRAKTIKNQIAGRVSLRNSTKLHAISSQYHGSVLYHNNNVYSTCGYIFGYCYDHGRSHNTENAHQMEITEISIAPLSEMGTSLKGKDFLQEGAIFFL